MNQVHLQPDGRLLTDGRTIVVAPLAYLGHQVLLADACRLRTYFHLFEIYPILIQLGELYPLLLQQYRQAPAEDCRWQAFDALVLTKTIEMVGHPGRARIDIYNSLKGFSAAQTDSPHEIRSLALDFLLDMPLRLGVLRHVVFGDRMDVFTFDTTYSLFELIDSIAWELSFHGTPKACQLKEPNHV
ncbi:MAG: hypothetical protein VR64_09440 [Desulfatitalea sp. BRH_c12]|nr:MAG: hypothetical protein VR64_09440 [Desulfatitalea sp. BRH_c12]